MSGGSGNDGQLGGSGADTMDGGDGLNVCDPDPADLSVLNCPFDSQGPTMLSFSVSKTSVNTSMHSATVDVSVRMIDNLMGVQDVNIGRGCSGCSWDGGSATLTSGDASDGIYTATLEIKAGSPQGTYIIQVGAVDMVGNWSWYRPTADGNIHGPDNAILGPGVIQQVGAGDATPPELVQISTSTTSVNSSIGTQHIVVSVHILDSGTGVQDVNIGRGCSGCSWDGGSATLTSGDASDGIYTATLEIKAGSPQGTYIIQVGAVDMVGNWSWYRPTADGNIHGPDNAILGPGVIINAAP